MDILGIYIFNSTRNQWLQDDERSWGSFAGAAEFNEAQLAEDIRVRETSGDDVTFTMGAFH